ncbi:MAG: leucine-rich repeat domain-containing protein [Bacteroidia bacterium]
MNRFFLVLLLFTLCCSAGSIAQPDYQLEGKLFSSLKEALAQPDSVTRLSLRRKRLRSIPLEVYLFPNLRELDLGSNKISALPDDLGRLEKLEILRLSRNKLDSLNKSIGDLKELRYLDLGKNNISKLPYEIGNLRKLEFLQIWGNEVSQLPESISDLTTLKWLDMRAILLTDSEREDILLLLPDTELLISPGCNCGK